MKCFLAWPRCFDWLQSFYLLTLCISLKPHFVALCFNSVHYFPSLLHDLGTARLEADVSSRERLCVLRRFYLRDDDGHMGEKSHLHRYHLSSLLLPLIPLPSSLLLVH